MYFSYFQFPYRGRFTKFVNVFRVKMHNIKAGIIDITFSVILSSLYFLSADVNSPFERVFSHNNWSRMLCEFTESMHSIGRFIPTVIYRTYEYNRHTL